MSDVLYGPAQPTSGQPPDRKGTYRRPRGIVRINNAACSFIGADISNRSHFTSDIYSVHLEPWNQPEGFGIDFWSNATDALVEVLFGFLPEDAQPGDVPADLTSLILGQVDDVDIDPCNGTLTISGRDLSARLIDRRTTNRWPDRTATEIVRDIASSNDLQVDIPQETKTPAGQYYHKENFLITRETPLWDIIVFLAQQEGFDAYVKGKTLYFGPPQGDTDPTPWPIYVQRDVNGSVWSNTTSLHLRRSLTIAGDLQVTVLSHDPVTGRTIEETQVRAGKHGPRNTASGYAAKQQQYVIRKPSMSSEAASQLAKQMLLDISKFERVIEFDSEGDLSVSPQRKIKLSGTSSDFDQEYNIDTVRWRLSSDGGLSMNVHAKNHVTESNTFL